MCVSVMKRVSGCFVRTYDEDFRRRQWVSHDLGGQTRKFERGSFCLRGNALYMSPLSLFPCYGEFFQVQNQSQAWAFGIKGGNKLRGEWGMSAPTGNNPASEPGEDWLHLIGWASGNMRMTYVWWFLLQCRYGPWLTWGKQTNGRSTELGPRRWTIKSSDWVDGCRRVKDFNTASLP